MPRPRNGHQPLGAGTGVEVLPAHLTGHEVVRLPVDEQNGNAGLGHRLAAVGVVGVKPPVEQRAHPPHSVDGPHERRGHHGLQHLGADVVGTGVAAVRNDAPYRLGQVQPAGQQHGGCPHGNPHEEDGHLRPEAVVRPVGPRPAVVPLLHPHGDGVSPAGAVTALVGQQHVVAQTLAQRVAAHAVPAGKPLVPVENDGQRCAVGMVIVPRRQQRAVVCCDLHRLVGCGLQRLGVLFQLGPVGQRLGQFLGVGVLRLGAVIKPDAVNAIGRPQYRSGRRGRGCRPGCDQMTLFHMYIPRVEPDMCSSTQYSKIGKIVQCSARTLTITRGYKNNPKFAFLRPARKMPALQKNHLHFAAGFAILYKFPVQREPTEHVRS